MKTIEFRQMERDAKCACCGRTIKRNTERVVVFFKKTHPGGSVGLCPECIKLMNKASATQDTKKLGIWPSEVTEYQIGEAYDEDELVGEILKIWTYGGKVFVSEVPFRTTHIQWSGSLIDNSNYQIMTTPQYALLDTSIFTEIYATLRQ